MNAIKLSILFDTSISNSCVILNLTFPLSPLPSKSSSCCTTSNCLFKYMLTSRLEKATFKASSSWTSPIVRGPRLLRKWLCNLLVNWELPTVGEVADVFTIADKQLRSKTERRSPKIIVRSMSVCTSRGVARQKEQVRIFSRILQTRLSRLRSTSRAMLDPLTCSSVISVSWLVNLVWH